MFLSQRKSSSSAASQTKGLQSLAIDRSTIPAHLSQQELKPATAHYRPDSKIPTRGATELTKEDRHRAHLRKKRTQKVERKRKDELLRNLAKNNGKLKSKLEKQDALKMLGKQKNVQIIKSSKMGKKQQPKK